MKNEKHSIATVSAEITRLPQSRTVHLSSGRRLEAGRLSWLQFETVWPELSGVLAALVSNDAEPGVEELLDGLQGIPACLLRLAVLGTNLTEEEAARLPFDDVLVVAAAVIELNFVQTAGVRSFFTTLTRLAPQETDQAVAGPAPRSTP